MSPPPRRSPPFPCPPPSGSQAAAATALVGPQDSVAAMAHEFTERLQLMVEGLGTIPGVHLVPPQGAFYVFPDLSAFFGRRGPRSEEHTSELQSQSNPVCRLL